MVVNSDGPGGCLGVAKLCRLGGYPGVDVPKLLRTTSVLSCSAFPIDDANCGLLSSESQWIVVTFTN